MILQVGWGRSTGTPWYIVKSEDIYETLYEPLKDVLLPNSALSQSDEAYKACKRVRDLHRWMKEGMCRRREYKKSKAYCPNAQEKKKNLFSQFILLKFYILI